MVWVGGLPTYWMPVLKVSFPTCTYPIFCNAPFSDLIRNLHVAFGVGYQRGFRVWLGLKGVQYPTRTHILCLRLSGKRQDFCLFETGGGGGWDSPSCVFLLKAANQKSTFQQRRGQPYFPRFGWLWYVGASPRGLIPDGVAPRTDSEPLECHERGLMHIFSGFHVRNTWCFGCFLDVS